MQTKVGANHDDRATGIIHSFSKEILPKPSLFTLQHVAKRLERSLICPCDNLSPSPIIKEDIHCLLKHPLFISHDDIGGAQIQESFQPVIPVDHPPIKVI